MSGELRWEQLPADTRLPLDQWCDPYREMPFWSTPAFRRAAVAAPPQRLALLVASLDGRPVLAAPLVISDKPGGLLFYDVPAMIGDTRAFGTTAPAGDLTAARVAAYPSVAVATHGAYHGILVDPEIDRDAALAQLPGALAGLGYASSAVLYCDTTMLRALRPAGGQVAVLGAETALETGHDNFDDYVAALSAHRRGRIRRERRDYLAGPLRTAITEGPGALGEDLVELRAGLREKYGLDGNRDATRAEFALLARECGANLVVARTRWDDDVVGFVVFLRDGARMYARTGGFDHDRLGPGDFVYFNLAYYDALAWALPRGVRRFEYGLSAYPAKRTRGCHFEPRYGLFQLPGTALGVALAEQDRTERERLAADCGPALRPLVEGD
jgi:predicted N-acyltransferase